MNYSNDKRVVMTLDAGGTNFVFSAMQAGKEIIDPVNLPSNGDDLDKCLQTIISGFHTVKKGLAEMPAAISFAFPGPADYPAGIIGDLGNLPAFRGGVALGPLLENEFNLPVFINNDGDLFTLGEAIAGFLPDINSRLAEAGSPKRFNNLFGITLGTGFGGGLVRNGELYRGDNSAACEIWITRNKLFPASFAEEGASIRAVQRVYEEITADKNNLTPKEIFDIASGTKAGNPSAAREAFRRLGETVGDALANAMTLIDGLVVIGGGLSGAHPLILPEMINEMNGSLETLQGDPVSRLVAKVYNLEDTTAMARFLTGSKQQITIPGTDKTILHDPEQRMGIGISRLGTNKAVAIGAYVFALDNLD